MSGHDTLVLDMTGTPIGFVGWKKAVTLIFKDRATVIDEDAARILRSPSFEMGLPTVIRVRNAWRRRKKTVVPFSRRNIAIRDNSECQYCGKLLTLPEYTLDHVVPRVQGGRSHWANIVLSCIRCNKYKSGQTPAEAGMHLRKQPVEPRPDDPKYNFKLRIKKMHPTWKPYVDGGWLYAEKAAYSYWNVSLEE
jgi:5-methylcytosine-specific restriction endonuclease McrA